MELKLLSLSEDDKLIRECMEQASAFYGCLGKMGVTEILCDRKKAQELGADCQITGIFTGGELTAFACAFEYTGLKRNGRKWLNPGDKEWRQIETLGTNVVVIPLLVGKEKVGRLIELLREQYRDSHLLFRISGEQSEKFQEDLAVVSEKNLKSHRYDAAGENVWLFHFAPQIRMEDTYFEEEILLILPGQEVLLEMGIEEAEVTMVKLTGYEIVRSEKGSAFFRKPGAACEGVLLQCDYEQLLRYQRFINLTNYEEHFEQTDRGKALIYSEKYQSDSSLLWNDLLREMVKTRKAEWSIVPDSYIMYPVTYKEQDRLLECACYDNQEIGNYMHYMDIRLQCETGVPFGKDGIDLMERYKNRLERIPLGRLRVRITLEMILDILDHEDQPVGCDAEAEAVLSIDRLSHIGVLTLVSLSTPFLLSHFLDMGTEINAVALKYQIANTKWISSEKFPVMDMKWIAGQYYKKICNYTDLPVSQESFNRAFHVESNLWNTQREENSFLVVEDEFQNLFELTRLFATRGTQQGFINVISENYLLRDYMLGNAQTFISDPKAIPTIVADYARTERNTILKLIMRMAEEQVSEDEIVDALMVSGIKFEDPLAALKNLIYKHCFIKEINIRIYFREQLMEDALHTEVKKYYAIEEETEIAEYAKKLQNAYYIAEDEQGDKYYIGAKLYGHVFQALIPGQFLTYDGKYYEVQAITPQNGVVVRRAADHITDRVYYRQLRHIRINDWKDDENIGGQKSVEGISIYKGYCEIDIETAGYLEMTSYENLNAAKEVRVSGIPVRSYRNKLVMKLNLPDVSERVRYTLCLLLNEIFRTIYPDAYPYICAVTLVDTNHAPEKLKGAMYTLSGKVDGSAIYIVEDSEIDLGLIASVERNLKRYFEIITEVLMWHEQKMAENPKKESKPEDYETPFTPEAGKEEEAAKKAREKAEKENKRFLGKIKRKLRKFWEKITAGFKKKPKDEPVEETPTEETPTEETPTEETPTEETPIEETPEEGISEDSPTEETTSTDERDTETGTENVMKNVMYSAEAEMDIEGEDEQLVEQKMTKKTEYQKSCFLKYGYEEIDPYFDFGGTIKYLTKYGYDRNPLQQVRDGVKAAEADNAKYDPHKEGSHFCDFCGVELAGGEYELLKDGRERCNHCSSTALRTGEEFKEVYKMVVRNMEIFFGIKLNVAIKVRMTDAKTIAKHFGDEFVATPGFDGRVLGFAQKDSSGYSLYIENGSPKLAAMATIAHELTHIWQYQNWDEKMILSKYGKQYRLEIYEGMAKWAEIQYLLYLNEISYAKRQEIVTRLRDDEYGRGFIQYAKKYPLAYRHEKNATPFGRIPPL